MENTPEMLPDLRPERRFSSNIGLGLLAYALVSLVLQSLAQILLAQYAPELLKNSFVFYTALLLPTYVVGTPICALTMRFSKATPPEKKKLRPSHFFIALLMCMTLLYSGNLLGNIFGTLADSICGGQSGISQLITDSSPLANLVFVVILAPIFEEFIFRKLIVDRFRRYGEAAAVISSGLLFGLFHGNFYQFFYAALIGMLLAYLYAKTGRLRITVALHMIVNFFGGFIAPMILELLGTDYEAVLNDAANKLASGEVSEEMLNEIFSQILAILPGMATLSIYSMTLLGSAVAGLVLFIVKRRKFTFSPGEVNLGGNAFSVTWVNVGVILFSVFCAVLFALNLTA